jgi:hypothetical protein
MDFNENYLMKLQNKIQTMNWHSTQVTILVMIIYQKIPTCDLFVYNFELLKDVHYFISNDPTHNIGFVQHSFLLH